MRHDDLGDALSFIEEPRREAISLRPAAQKQPARWLTLLGAFSTLALAVAAFSIYEGVIPMSWPQNPAKERPKRLVAPVIPQARPAAVNRPVAPADPPPMSPPPSVSSAPSTSLWAEPSTDQPPAKAAPTVVAAPKVVAAAAVPARPRRPSDGRGDATKDSARTETRLAPEEVLEEKGLKLVGREFHLTDKEAGAQPAYNNYLTTFDKALKMNVLLYERIWYENMLNSANDMRAGIAFDNAELNTAMDRVPTWGGPRQNSLNNFQKDMHFQLLNNRESSVELDRTIYQLNSRIKTLPPPQKLASEFERLSSICREGYKSAENAMHEVAGAYDQLRQDQAVKDALAEINGKTKSSKVVTSSAKFSKALKRIRDDKAYFEPVHPRPSRKR
jgi:hypothetical protein